MFESTSPLAPDRRVFTPRVVPLDIGSDGLASFAAENTREVQPISDCPASPPRTPALGATRVRLRVPGWLGAGGLAILTGALTGLLIASFFQTPVVALPTGGAVTITSEPPALPVRVDGLLRGVTPFATVLAPGPHRIEIGSGSDARTRQLQVRAGVESQVHVAWPTSSLAAAPSTTATVAPSATPAARERAAAAAKVEIPAAAAPAPHARAAAIPRTPPAVPPPTGSLSVTSPFPVRVLVDGWEVGTSASAKLPIDAGTHTVTLVNERLEFEQAQEVTVAARKTQTLTVDPPHGTLHVNASPWAQVMVDGRRAGETPIGNLALPIGEHEIVLKHPELGEQRRTVTVGARTPVRVGVEFGR